MANSSASKGSSPTAPVNVLLIGGGGREHALAWKLKQSKRLGKLFITDASNPGLAALGTPVDVPVDIKQIYRLQSFCNKNEIGLVVIGPEEPLAEGFADQLAAKGRVIFGPTQSAARLESDKAWCKQLMRQAAIPTAEGRIFTDAEQARSYVESRLADRQAAEKFIDAAATGVAARSLEPSAIVRTLLSGRGEDVAPALDRFARGLGQIRDFDERLTTLLGALIDIAAAGRELSRSRAQASGPAHDELSRAVVSIVLEAARTLRDPTDRRAMVTRVVQRDKTVAAAYAEPHTDLPVIKACGLAKGKGVILPSTLAEAIDAIGRIMVKMEFGDAGKTVLIEERLEGREVSVLALTDGRSIYVLEPCQDHKRLGDNDTGPNTGGMGVVCPGGIVGDSDALMHQIQAEILVPTLDAMRREGITYQGVLYAGLMLTPAGPKVLEFNCRFGDPECQALMARLDADLIDVLMACGGKSLEDAEINWAPAASCVVVLAAGGYPGKPKANQPITGLEAAAKVPGVQVFHSGTRRDEEGRIVTSGGRVLSVTAAGPNMGEARRRAYEAAAAIQFEGKQMRTDIGAVAAPVAVR
ncbi:MAG: phosphoribosylamine--glycine ligase [Phycisphaerales bacterium]|nr:phosphoribosylamine--glycine ligase [Phycisphaerales bacterium]